MREFAHQINLNPADQYARMLRFPIDAHTARPLLQPPQAAIMKLLSTDKSKRQTVASKLHNNSEAMNLDPRSVFGDDQPRPLSAFYYVRNSGEIIVQVGLVKPNQEGTLHDQLRETSLYNSMILELQEYGPDAVVSGHYWGISTVPIVMFDYLETAKERRVRDNPRLEFLIDSLTNDGFVCIDSEGMPLVCGATME